MLVANEKYQFEVTNSNFKLIVADANQSDEGKYQFKSVNDLGSIETSCQAYVFG